MDEPAAIVEHARNLSGRRDGQQPSARESLPATAQFPSESGHWYDPKTGHQVELPPRTWTKTYIAKGYVPGVTTIGRQVHKEQLRTWDIGRAVKFTHTEVASFYNLNGFTFTYDDDDLIQSVRGLMQADSNATMNQGKALHRAIELAAQGIQFDSNKWGKHVRAVGKSLAEYGIVLYEGNTEHSFATSSYGGKIDWHNDEWLLDFKTKPSIIEGKKLAYPEHAQQLAAYMKGLGRVPEGNCLRWRKCANVFVGADDAKVVFHEWSEKDLLQGWREFDALCSYWWVKNQKP